MHGYCTPWPDTPHLSGSQEVGLRISRLLCKERTHAQPKLAEPRPSHARPCSALSVCAIDWLPKRRPSLPKNIERRRSLISFFFYFQEISQQFISAPTFEDGDEWPEIRRASHLGEDTSGCNLVERCACYEPKLNFNSCIKKSMSTSV